MQYSDPIHGPAEITAPVLLDLLASRAVQRLKDVLQHGVTALLGLTQPITRYEHSVGTMILVERLGGPLEEQVAALLHDVSHTAFSHVIDHVFGGHGPASYHEQQKGPYLARSDVPALLAGHGLRWERFLSDEPFPLLEQPAPRLCADRLDYFLRDAAALGILSPADVVSVRAHLRVWEGVVALDDLDAARLVAHRYLEADERSWSEPTEVGLYELTARAVRLALVKGRIAEDDLWEGDQGLWDRLARLDDPEVAATLALVSARPRFVVDRTRPTLWARPRVRSVDPDVIHQGRLSRLSQLDVTYARFRDAYLERKSGPMPLRLVEGGA